MAIRIVCPKCKAGSSFHVRDQAVVNRPAPNVVQVEISCPNCRAGLQVEYRSTLIIVLSLIGAVPAVWVIARSGYTMAAQVIMGMVYVGYIALVLYVLQPRFTRVWLKPE